MHAQCFMWQQWLPALVTFANSSGDGKTEAEEFARWFGFDVRKVRSDKELRAVKHAAREWLESICDNWPLNDPMLERGKRKRQETLIEEVQDALLNVRFSAEASFSRGMEYAVQRTIVENGVERDVTWSEFFSERLKKMSKSERAKLRRDFPKNKSWEAKLVFSINSEPISMDLYQAVALAIASLFSDGDLWRRVKRCKRGDCRKLIVDTRDRSKKGAGRPPPYCKGHAPTSTERVQKMRRNS